MSTLDVVVVSNSEEVQIVSQGGDVRLISGGDGGSGSGSSSSTSRKPIVALLTGQSNAQIETPYVWPVSKRLYVWNWDGTAAGIGTGWVKHPGTWINAGVRFLSELADRLDTDIYVMKLGWGGIPISDFIYGVKFIYSNTTTLADPTNTFMRLNNAAYASVTKIMVSVFDMNLQNRVVNWLQVAAGHVMELRNAAGAVVAKFTVSGPPVNNTTWWEIPVTFLPGGTGAAITNGDQVRLIGQPNMQTIFNNNVPPALALVPGAPTKIDMKVWSQGEADAGAPNFYSLDYNELDTILQQKSWYPLNTPAMLIGVSPTSNTGDPGYDTINNFLQNAAAFDPDRRMFVYPGIFPIAYWDAAASYFHMTAAGYDLAGKMFCDNWLFGTGRKVQKGIVVDPVTANIGIGGVPQAGFKLLMVQNQNAASSFGLSNASAGASASAGLLLTSNAGTILLSAGSIAGGSGAVNYWTGTGPYTLYGVGNLRFAPGAVDAGGFDTSAHFMLGTPTAIDALAGTLIPRLQSHGLLADSASIGITNWGNVGGGAVIILAKARSGTIGTHGVPISGDTVGVIIAAMSDGSLFRRGGEMRFLVDGTAGVNDYPTMWTLSLTPDGTASPVEYLRVNNAGVVSHRSNAQVVIDANSHHQYRSYTVATLPSAATAGQQIWCSDLGGGAGMLESDGTVWKRLSHGGQETLATDADFTLTTLTNGEDRKHTGTLTANRSVTLSTTNAYKGARFRLSRTGGGAFTLTIAGKALSTNQWAEAEYDGSAWYLAAAGSL